MQNYNLCIIGDGGVGKTSYVRRLIEDKFNPRYKMSMDTTNKTIHINTEKGEFSINLRDYPGQERAQDIRTSSYSDIDGCIIMASNSKISLFHIPEWNKEFRRISKAPIVIVLSKLDIKDYNVNIPDYGYPIVSISSKNRDNLYAPIMYLLSLL